MNRSKQETFAQVVKAGLRGMDITYTSMQLYAKQEAIWFAKWMDDMGYTWLRDGDKWESLNDFSGKTTDQLYDIYQQSKATQ